MTRDQSKPTSEINWPLRAVALLFFGSGCSALIYEVIWLQMLGLLTGSSAISIGILLATFMGGMCLGSFFSPKVLRALAPTVHPIRLYAMSELGLGICGLLVWFGLPYAAGLYAGYGGSGLLGLFLRGALSGLFLLPPTILMGATLPIVSRGFKESGEEIFWLSLFYGGNLAGAVFGSLLSGFYLLPRYDEAVATYVAVSINFVVAFAGCCLAGRIKVSPVTVDHVDSRAALGGESGATAVYVAIALSGLSALGAEVVWTRALSLMLGGTVYTFSLILSVFLIGLGIGAQAGSVISRRVTQARLALVVCQLLLTFAIAWSAYLLSYSLPYWPIYPPLSLSAWISFQVDFVRCMIAILPATLLWGASFPLALASAATPIEDADDLVARTYAANTAGAIVGALTFSLVFIKWFGIQHAQQILVLIAGIASIVVLYSSSLSRKSLRALGVAALSGGLAFTISPLPSALTAYGRLLPFRMGLVNPNTRQHVEPIILYQADGLNSSVAVSLGADGVRSFHVSGKVEASSAVKDMQLQRMLGSIPLTFHPHPRTVLIVGFGSGVTAGTFVLDPEIERIVICEIEPLIPQFVSKYFEKENNHVLDDPRVEVVYDDARHFILTSDMKFDIITSDPIHPWVKGSAALYTREYFDLVRRHLNPGGVVSQWVPLYDTGPRTVKSEVATFTNVFPNATLWSTYQNGFGQDVVLIGGEGVSTIDLDDEIRRAQRPEFRMLANSLGEVGFTSPLELLGTYAGRTVDLETWLDGAEVNRDTNLRLQYTAGTELNLDQGLLIYRDMVAHRRFPTELFLGSDEILSGLKNRILGPH